MFFKTSQIITHGFEWLIALIFHNIMWVNTNADFKSLRVTIIGIEMSITLIWGWSWPSCPKTAPRVQYTNPRDSIHALDDVAMQHMFGLRSHTTSALNHRPADQIRTWSKDSRFRQCYEHAFWDKASIGQVSQYRWSTVCWERFIWEQQVEIFIYIQ